MATSIDSTRAGSILLVSANKLESPYPVYPLGVAHIAHALKKQHQVDHFDLLALGGISVLEEQLRDKNYDIIGISIRNIDTVDSKNPEGLLSHIKEIIALVRKSSKAFIILGGPGFSIMPDLLLEYLEGDYGIVGEGEEAFPDLAAKILSGNLPAEKLHSKNLSNYPTSQPVYFDTITPYYLQRGGMLNIQTKRGCNFGCSYCSYPTIEGKKLRFRDPNEVAEEVKRLTTEHEARYIFFTDGVFNDPTGHYLQVGEALIRKGNTTPWCAFFRPQNLGREELKLLKKSGLTALELGTDAASDTTLSALNKGFTFSEALAVHNAALSESLPCAHFIMFGGPGETEATVEEGISNMEKLEKSVVFPYIGIRILPQTKLYQRALEEEIVQRDTNLIEPLFYYSPHVKRSYIEQKLETFCQNEPTRIFGMEEMDRYVQLLHSLGHPGPLWDLLLKKSLKRS